MELLQNVFYFVVLAGLIFIMMRYGCGAHMMGHRHHHGGTMRTRQSDLTASLRDRSAACDLLAEGSRR